MCKFWRTGNFFYKKASFYIPKGSSIIDNNPKLAREIYEQKGMEYAMDDITGRIKDNFKNINADDLSGDEIKRIAEAFHATLKANGTFWDVYWELADYAIEEHLKDRKVNISLEDRVKKAQENISDGRLEGSCIEEIAR